MIINAPESESIMSTMRTVEHVAVQGVATFAVLVWAFNVFCRDLSDGVKSVRKVKASRHHTEVK